MRPQTRPKTALVPAHNLQHNVPVRLSEAERSLTTLADLYFRSQVAGQADATIDAKRRDLGRFLGFYRRLYRHDRPEEWYVAVTREFLKQLRKAQPAPATVARTYASVRHFARWIHHKGQPFPLGCPTDGIKPPQEPEAEWKGLSRTERVAAHVPAHARRGKGRAVRERRVGAPLGSLHLAVCKTRPAEPGGGN